VADFFEAARILDRQRLNKQRVECYQILQTLAGISTTHSWANHPAERIVTLVQDAMYQHVWGPTNAGAPYWMGAEGFHLSHKSNLILKDPEYYQKYWPDIPPGLPYIWPPYRGE
jgi:hypothetical protein